MKLSAYGVATLAFATVLLGIGSPAASEERDFWNWPFASTSPWNTPLGDQAALVPAHFPTVINGERSYMGIDLERHVRLSPEDPERPVYPPSSWDQRWPGDDTWPWRNGVQWYMPVPDDFRMADANPPHTPNACVSFLMPDGRELRQLEPTTRLWDDDYPDRRIIGWPAQPVDMYGDGIYGAHWGSGLSVLGGSLRTGSLSSDEPLRHALKLNVWAEHLHYNDDHRGFRWPADRADSYAATGYKGSLPALRMGALLALPPDLGHEDLNITSQPGRKIFDALQRYGAYIADDTAWNAYDFCAEEGVWEEVQAMGYEFTGRSGTLVEEFHRIVAVLCVVDDNGPDSIGGAGNRLAPVAPALVDPDYTPVENLQAEVAGTSVVLSWSAPLGWSSDAYEIQRRSADDPWQSLASSYTTGLVDPDPGQGQLLSYRVRGLASNTGNAGPWSQVDGVQVTGQRVLRVDNPHGLWIMQEIPDGRWAEDQPPYLLLDSLDPQQTVRFQLLHAPNG